MEKPVKEVDKSIVRKIHEKVLFEIHGESFLPFAKYLDISPVIEEKEEDNQVPDEYIQPEQEDDGMCV